MFHPHLAPLIFGTAVIFGLALYLFINNPSPGLLSEPHQALTHLSRLSGCVDCHSEKGLAEGCLSCHDEIAEQLDAKTGYHTYLLGDVVHCTQCHSEHNGTLFPLTGPLAWQDEDPNTFDHPHVEFSLIDRHNEIYCDDCHYQEGDITFALNKFPDNQRTRTFLGLNQECVTCHEDVHAGGLAADCSECHGQKEFDPATFFDHEPYLPLEKGHASVACKLCHVLPEIDDNSEKKSLPFDHVRGNICSQCHESPHYVVWERDCESCHPTDASPWLEGAAAITDEVHALTGFQLVEPHADVTCEKCHDPELPYEKQYPDPFTVGYQRHEESCQGCHYDVHEGQFQPFYTGCLDCHQHTSFLPVLFGLDDHDEIFALEATHRKTECNECHKISVSESLSGDGDAVRMYRGLSNLCVCCHQDNHLGQFAETDYDDVSCGRCHPSPTVWLDIDFDHNTDSQYELDGAHLEVSCQECHKKELFLANEYVVQYEPSDYAVRYKPMGKKCDECHVDIHNGQFIQGDSVNCERCHPEPTQWANIDFEHNLDTRFALEGVHSEIDCGKCHVEEKLQTGESFVRYKPLGMRCDDCHFDIHWGQFRTAGQTNCNDCHETATSWGNLTFDHNRDSRFCLDGIHASVSCGLCHIEVTLTNGEKTRQFKPLSILCVDCHGFTE